MKYSKTIKNVLSLAACLHLLSACGENAVKKGLTSQNNTVETMGTGDGGGGNAINFKMLESYKIDPLELPAVKSELKELLEKSMAVDSEVGSSGKDGIELFVKTKNWYLAPINLKKIPKDVLGISMTDDNHQQIAIQTKEAIWIDENLFNKMSPQDQATLVMHEIVMGLYLMRFYTFEDYVAFVKKVNTDVEEEFLEHFAKEFKSQTPRALVSADYEEIRDMTAWVMKNRKNLSLSVFYDELTKRDYFSFLNILKAKYDLPKEIQEKIITLNSAQVQWLITSAQEVNALSSKCLEGVGESFDCSVETNVSEDKRELLLTVNHSKSGKVVKNAKVQALTEMFGKKGYVSFYAVFMTGDSVIFETRLLEESIQNIIDPNSSGKKGEIVTIQMALNKDSMDNLASARLWSVGIQTNIVKNIGEVEYADKVCVESRLESFRGSTINESPVLVYTKWATEDYLKSNPHINDSTSSASGCEPRDLRQYLNK